MHRLAQALTSIRSTRSKKRKVAILAAFLRSLDESEVPVAARLVLGAIRPPGVGWALLTAAAAQATQRPAEEVNRLTRQTGDLGDALSALAPELTPTLGLRDIPDAIQRVATAGSRDEQQRALADLLSRASPEELRYLAKSLTGELRVGLQRGLFEEALAEAFGASVDEVRRASALLADPGQLALRARAGTLSSVTLEVGTPVSFMLAAPAEEVKQPVDPALTVAEDKLDGVRTQAHVQNGRVWLYARGLDDVTARFPEVARRLGSVPAPIILDGEIIAVSPEGRPRPFQVLQNRLGRGQASIAAQTEVPVTFMAFDCLFHGEALLTRPWSERRAQLEALGPWVTCNPVRPLTTAIPIEVQLDALFTEARARGNEGLMLKRIDAPYEAGRRSSAWRKVKRAYATLDVVITKAEHGHGRRAEVLSDYTFAVWRSGSLVDIGKAFTGLTDAEIVELTHRLQELTLRREGPYHVVRPDIVLEVAFDGIQRSRRHGSGFALRFPRIVRVRDDKAPSEANDLAAVQALYRAQLDSGHREEPRQLGLF